MGAPLILGVVVGILYGIPVVVVVGYKAYRRIRKWWRAYKARRRGYAPVGAQSTGTAAAPPLHEPPGDAGTADDRPDKSGLLRATTVDEKEEEYQPPDLLGELDSCATNDRSSQADTPVAAQASQVPQRRRIVRRRTPNGSIVMTTHVDDPHATAPGVQSLPDKGETHKHVVPPPIRAARLPENTAADTNTTASDATGHPSTSALGSESEERIDAALPTASQAFLHPWAAFSQSLSTAMPASHEAAVAAATRLGDLVQTRLVAAGTRPSTLFATTEGKQAAPTSEASLLLLPPPPSSSSLPAPSVATPTAHSTGAPGSGSRRGAAAGGAATESESSAATASQSVYYSGVSCWSPSASTTLDESLDEAVAASASTAHRHGSSIVSRGATRPTTQLRAVVPPAAPASAPGSESRRARYSGVSKR